MQFNKLFLGIIFIIFIQFSFAAIFEQSIFNSTIFHNFGADGFIKLNVDGWINYGAPDWNQSSENYWGNDLAFVKYDNSVPSFSDGNSSNGGLPSGGWLRGDQYAIYSTIVLKDENEVDANKRYKLWYSARNSTAVPNASTGSGYGIYYATSPDGLTWTKYDNILPWVTCDTNCPEGVIVAGSNGKGDDYYVYRPTVIQDVNIYKMWYIGYGGAAGQYGIYYATSPDGINWTKLDNTQTSTCDAGAPCEGNGKMGLGTSGKGDDASINDISVIKDGDTYKM